MGEILLNFSFFGPFLVWFAWATPETSAEGMALVAPYPDKPRPSHPEKLDFGPFRLRFGSLWLRFGSVSGLFRVRFRVLGGVAVGSGRGASLREKEYH